MNQIERQIVFITGLPLWSMGQGKGAISFEATIEGYKKAGYNILIVSDSKVDHNYLGVEAFVLNMVKLNKFRNLRYLGWFIRLFLWVIFSFYAICKVALNKKWRRSSVFYGYEVFGVPACYVLSKLFNGLCVSRFQGTILFPLMNRKFWKIQFFEHWFAMIIKTDLVIMANDGTKGLEVLKAIGVKEEKIKFWRNGVKMPERFPQEIILKLKKSLGIDDDEKVICTISRLVSWKRVDRVIEAMPILLNGCQKIKLIIVGDGDKRNDYESLVAELKIKDNVQFVGAIPQNEVMKYLQLADLFVSFYDLSNVGNPLMEAMMVGKAIITLNNGDTKEIITNNVNGILLELNELDKIPETIKLLLQNDTLSKRLASNAIVKAKECFCTWEERMEKEIKEVEKYT